MLPKVLAARRAVRVQASCSMLILSRLCQAPIQASGPALVSEVGHRLAIEHMFDYTPGMENGKLFELRRRTFDTPHFRGIEFIEVESKSIINHVPGNYLPFNWTINPYRGCQMLCSYCFARSTHTYMDMNAGRDFE